MVEQATENRRVPSSNLGPGINDQLRSTRSLGREQRHLGVIVFITKSCLVVMLLLFIHERLMLSLDRLSLRVMDGLNRRFRWFGLGTIDFRV